MQYQKALTLSEEFLRENIMGPNPAKLLEELLARHPIPAGSTVLDLGCGRGVTSILLAREYGLHVFATDLWVAPTENRERFDAMGLSSRQIVPVYAEAHALPYAESFFDAAVCIDAYHYFGRDPDYLDKHLLPLVKPGGLILIAVPGLTRDVHADPPPELLLSWTKEDLETLCDRAYWRRMLESAEGAQILSVDEMQGVDECWADWLACDNPYAVGDRKAMRAGAGKYMNFIAMALRRRGMEPAATSAPAREGG